LRQGLPKDAIAHFREQVRQVRPWDYDALTHLLRSADPTDVTKYAVMEEATRHVHRSDGRTGVERLYEHCLQERMTYVMYGATRLALGVASCGYGHHLFWHLCKGYDPMLAYAAICAGVTLAVSGADRLVMASNISRGVAAVRTVGARLDEQSDDPVKESNRDLV
jgi:hypothetical protein